MQEVIRIGDYELCNMDSACSAKVEEQPSYRFCKQYVKAMAEVNSVKAESSIAKRFS